MPKKSSLTKQDIEKLLSRQTNAILNAVDKRLDVHLKAMNQRFDVQEVALVAEMERRFERTDKRFGDKLDKLMTTLDRFLKRLTDFEDEFELLKREVSRMKAAIREKLGVTVE